MGRELTGGPKTIVCLMAYGDLKTQTHVCWQHEVLHVAQINGQASYRNGLLREDVNIKGYGAQAKIWDVRFMCMGKDAQIERNRAFAVKHFLQTDAEILVLIDRDIEWKTPVVGVFEGDVLRLARQCSDLRGIVGAMICKKVRGQGIASLPKQDSININQGGDNVHPAWFVGGAFTAYHRSVLEAVTATMKEIPPGYTPIWQSITAEHPVHKGQQIALSEDWSLCARAEALGFRSWLSEGPIIKHWGDYGFDLCDAYPEMEAAAEKTNQQQQLSENIEKLSKHREEISKLTKEAAELETEIEKKRAEEVPEKKKEKATADKPIMFSLLHATRGRPEAARAVRQMWERLASGENNIEHIFSCDDDDPTALELAEYKPIIGKNRGNVDAWNRAAYAAKGKIFIQAHDDLETFQDWDKVLLERMDPDAEQVLQVSDGLPKQTNNDPTLLTILIGTRKYFHRIGYFYYPEIISVFCDNEISAKALKDGVVIDALDITFKHHWKENGEDEIYRRSYLPEKWKHGEAIFKKRKACGFIDVPQYWGHDPETGLVVEPVFTTHELIVNGGEAVNATMLSGVSVCNAHEPEKCVCVVPDKKFTVSLDNNPPILHWKCRRCDGVGSDLGYDGSDEGQQCSPR